MRARVEASACACVRARARARVWAWVHAPVRLSFLKLGFLKFELKTHCQSLKFELYNDLNVEALTWRCLFYLRYGNCEPLIAPKMNKTAQFVFV